VCQRLVRKTRYGEKVADAGVLGTASETTMLRAATLIAVMALDFFGERLWWWAAPTVAVLMVAIGAAILRHNAAIR
jgi:hypothetical protein